MASCPLCACARVQHLWRTDMAQLTLIDEWKCLDLTCGHRWDTTVTYAQLEERWVARGRTAGAPAQPPAVPS